MEAERQRVYHSRRFLPWGRRGVERVQNSKGIEIQQGRGRRTCWRTAAATTGTEAGVVLLRAPLGTKLAPAAGNHLEEEASLTVAAVLPPFPSAAEMTRVTETIGGIRIQIGPGKIHAADAARKILIMTTAAATANKTAHATNTVIDRETAKMTTTMDKIDGIEMVAATIRATTGMVIGTAIGTARVTDVTVGTATAAVETNTTSTTSTTSTTEMAGAATRIRMRGTNARRVDMTTMLIITMILIMGRNMANAAT